MKLSSIKNAAKVAAKATMLVILSFPDEFIKLELKLSNGNSRPQTASGVFDQCEDPATFRPNCVGFLPFCFPTP